MTIETVADFLEPVQAAIISEDEGYKNTQIGTHILLNQNGLPNIEAADAVIVGCLETRGSGPMFSNSTAANAIRKQLYKLFHWHKTITVADVGNVKAGSTIKDSYAALQTVVTELLQLNKKVIIIGGTHDVTLAQYAAYASQEKIVEATCVDAAIDLNMDSPFTADNFLMDMLTGEPNYIKHYNHIGFQSYMVHPHMLETIDKLRFDCYRVGKVKEGLEEMEPILRQSDFLSFDISAIQHAHAPANKLTPNGFTGEEACSLMQYAGLSNKLSSIGIYGYHAQQDEHELTAMQISQMIWYYIDGLYKSKLEADIEDRSQFNEFHLAMADFETTFLQSKKTGRWWMQVFDKKFIPCSKTDYVLATKNEIPERWLRYAER